MKTTAISENLIKLTRRNLVLPNAYLVREEDGFTLIDTTTRGAADKLIAAAARAGGKIRRIALTRERSDLVKVWDVVSSRLGRAPSTLLGVSLLGYMDQLVEIEAIATLAA